MALLALSALLLAAGIGRLLDAFGWELNAYDEGILLTDSWLVGKGRTPFADFYSNYPPGIFHLIHAWWLIVGASIPGERLLGAVIHLLTAALAGRIAGRIADKQFSWLACGMVLFWLTGLGDVAFAEVAALCAALAWIELSCVAYARSRTVFWAFSGLAFGTVGTFRHDLFVYLSVVLVGGAALYLVIARTIPRPPSLRRAGWFGFGALLPLLWVYGPVVLAGAWGPMFNDLYAYQAHWVAPDRRLRFPALLAPKTVSSLLFPLPAFLAENFEGAVALSLIAPILAVVGAVRRWSAQPLPVVLLALLSTAVLPQLFARFDQAHALYAVTPGLILAVGFLERLSIRGLAPCLAAVVGVCLLILPVAREFQKVSIGQASIPSSHGRLSGLAELFPVDREVVAYLDRRVRPGQRTFVAITDNSTTSAFEHNDVSIYFLADRESATRFMQFDPGLTSRASIQRQIISGLERWRPPAIVVSEDPYGAHFDNGSRLLDQFLRRDYALGQRFGTSIVRIVELRRPSAAIRHLAKTSRLVLHANVMPDGNTDAVQYVAGQPGSGGVLTYSHLGVAVPAETGRHAYIGDAYRSQSDSRQKEKLIAEVLHGWIKPQQARAVVLSSGARFLIDPCWAHKSLTRLLGPIIQSSHRFDCAVVYTIKHEPRAGHPSVV